MDKNKFDEWYKTDKVTGTINPQKSGGSDKWDREDREDREDRNGGKSIDNLISFKKAEDILRKEK